MFGSISRAEHQRKIVEFAEAYRWERDEALRVKREYETKLRKLASIEVSVDFMGKRRAILNIDDRLPRASVDHKDMEMLARYLVMDVMGCLQDYRPDMRDERPFRL